MLPSAAASASFSDSNEMFDIPMSISALQAADEKIYISFARRTL